MPYVIESTHQLKNSLGKEFTYISYFREHNFIFNSMDTIEKAKKYEFLSEARRDKRKFFGTSKCNKIVKITDPKPVNS